MNVEELKKAFKEREHIDSPLAWAMMTRATENNYTICFLWKIPNKKYSKWFKEYEIGKRYGTTLTEETTYIVYSGQKAFDSTKGGYSIFAQSIGSMKRGEVYFSLDRIEHLPLEYAIDITDLCRKEVK